MEEQSGNRSSLPSGEVGDDQAVPSSRKLAGSLLSQIVEFSELEAGEDRTNTEAEKALLIVAKKHSGQQQLNEEILQELVQVLIREVHSIELPLPSRMIQWVTQTLYSDPNARRRLEQLWVQLIGRSANGS